MTVIIDDRPFTDNGPGQWWSGEGFGPAWVEFLNSNRWRADEQVCAGITRFIDRVQQIAPTGMRYGTVYAAKLDGRALTPGSWHVDTGERTEHGAERYTSTWTSDGAEIGNVFRLPSGSLLASPNLHVVRFNEGVDEHQRPAQAARPGAWGVFVSMSLYADDEPANIDCPRLHRLAGRGPRSEQALAHFPITRDWHAATDWESLPTG
jgi:hypothetical protein